MVRLGRRVRDLITGMEGVSIARLEHLYGCVHIGVAPRTLTDNGKPADSDWYDEQRIEEIGDPEDDPVVKIVEPPIELPSLGAKAKDTITGFEGMVISRSVWFTGEANVTLLSNKLKDDKPIGKETFEGQRIQVIEEKAPPVSKSNSATSGGPNNEPVTPASMKD